MIRETLSALGSASRRALVNLTQQRDWSTQVAHVREWSFAMPYLSRVLVANSPVHQFYVGLSRDLALHFGQSAEAREHALEQLLETIKGNLLASLPAKRPIVTWERLEPSAEPRVLRGIRSFILRHHGAPGNLYLMADLASRCEFECLKAPTWLEETAAQLLPDDIGRIDCIENQAMLDRLCTFLARCEYDVELLIPGGDGNVHAVNGVVLRRTRDDGQLAMRLSIDLDRRLGVELADGLELEGAFGAAGRVFRFRATCLGEVPYSLDGSGNLACIDLAFPRRFHLDQRRRYFRIEPDGDLPATVQVLDGGETAAGTVLDLSFSGAGLSLPVAPAKLANEARVRVEMTSDAWPEPVAITGLVRRVQTLPRGRGRETTLVGIEFLVDGAQDREATQRIRQYVMARQRSLLALHNQ